MDLVSEINVYIYYTSIEKDCQNITSTTTITVKKRHH